MLVFISHHPLPACHFHRGVKCVFPQDIPYLHCHPPRRNPFALKRPRHESCQLLNSLTERVPYSHYTVKYVLLKLATSPLPVSPPKSLFHLQPARMRHLSCLLLKVSRLSKPSSLNKEQSRYISKTHQLTKFTRATQFTVWCF